MRFANIYISLIIILDILFCLPSSSQSYIQLYQLPAFDRAVFCIKFFEGMHTEKDYPYIGYGHRLREGEDYAYPMPTSQADSLLRADLRRLCRIFRCYGSDSLLLATLAYNVGVYSIMGNAEIPRSTLLKKIEAGNRNFKDDYLNFCHVDGDIVPGIQVRRGVELVLLDEGW